MYLPDQVRLGDAVLRGLPAVDEQDGNLPFIAPIEFRVGGDIDLVTTIGIAWLTRSTTAFIASHR